MNVFGLLWRVIPALLLAACAGEDNPDATATSTSKGSTGTTAATAATADTQGTTTAATTTSDTTTTTSDTTTTSPSTSTTESGCSFLECTDQGPSDVCDLWSQDCPEGQKCMPWAADGGSAWNSAKCTPLDPAPQGPGEACSAEGGGLSGVDNCEKASMCWDVDKESGEGTCVAFCQGARDDPTCDAGFHCDLKADGVLILCMPVCDPLAQDCPDGDTCLPSADTFSCVLDASGEAGVYGDPCEYANGCDPGLYCIPPDYVQDCKAAGCCTPFCDTSKPNTCPGDTQECIPWYEEGTAPPGNQNIGVCGIPQ